MEEINALATPTISTDEVYRGANKNIILTKELSDLETSIEALDDGKAPAVHAHSDYEAAIEQLDSAIAELRENGSSSGGSTVDPMLEASMHFGKIDNNNGAELSSATRICSDPFPVENGKSYWQVNDKAVAMYVLVYDADEMFAGYLGKFESGQEIVVNIANAAYMRLSSLIGEYDLTNKFLIYDANPTGGSSSGGTNVDAYTKTESDARYAFINHSHDNYAPANHTHDELHIHDNVEVLNDITAEKVAAWDAGTGSGSGEVVPGNSYTKAEADGRFAPMSHAHNEYMTKNEADGDYAPMTHGHNEYMTEQDANKKFAPVSHSHSEFAPNNHTHEGYAPANHNHTEFAYTDHDHIGYAPSEHTHSGYALTGHTHTGYATSTHTHSGYFSSNGGTINGDTNINGVVRVNGNQTLFDSGSMITLSTNNRETMIAGSKIYSKVAISTSSDARLKENVEPINTDECVEFVKALNVKQFNYKDDVTPCIGVIAQDVQNTDFGKFFVTVQPGEEGYLAVKAVDMVFPLITTVQKLCEEIENLKNK